MKRKFTKEQLAKEADRLLAQNYKKVKGKLYLSGEKNE